MADFRKRILTMRNRPSTAAPRLIDEEIIPSSGWTQFPEFHCLLVDLPGFRKDEIKFNVDDTGTIVVSGRRIIREGRQVHFEKSFSVPEDGDIKNISTQFEGDTLRVSVPKVPKEMKQSQEPEKTNGASIRSHDDTKEDHEKLALEEKRSTNQSLSVSNSVTNQQEYDDDIPASSSSKIDADNTNPIASTKETAAGSLIASRSTTKEDEKKEETVDEGPASSCYSEQQPSNSNDKTKEENTSSSQKSVMVKIVENKGILIASILSFTLGVFLSQKFHPQPPPK